MSDGTPEAVTDAGLGDPSMEDILASIRRIIADDAPADASPTMVANEEDTVDLRKLAEESAAHADQNETLVEAATPELIEAVDFDDILIMDDDAFSADDLDIPEADMFTSEDKAAPDTQLQSDIGTALGVSDAPDVSGLDEELFNMIESLEDSALEGGDDASASVISTSFPDENVLSADDMALIDLLDSGETDDLDILPLETVLPEPAAFSPIDELSDISKPAESMPTDSDPSVLVLDEDFDLLLDMDLAAEPVIEATEPLTAEPVIEMANEDETFGVLDIVESSLAELTIDEPVAEPEPIAETVEFDETFAAIEPVATNEAEAETVTPDIISIEDQHDDVVDLVESLLADKADEHEAVEDNIDVNLAVDPELAENVTPVSDDAFSALLDDEDDIAGDVDIDLVKSLMADLTDEALMTDDTGESGIEDITAEESDILDDILELTMNDEAKMSEDDLEELVAVPAIELEQSGADKTEIAAFDESVSAEPVSEETADPAIENVDSSINALLQIAAAAETDAREHISEPGLRAAEEITEAEIETVVSAAEPVENEPVQNNEGRDTDLADDTEADFADEPLAIESINFDLPDAMDTADDNVMPDSDEQALDTIDTPDTEVPQNVTSSDTALAETLPPQTDMDPAPQERENMPQLVAKDGILDGVAEAASVEAFASLNSIVEEKTVFAESGPRIGDLVQEALRPMLKEWLDDNLKGIVERAVSKEVKRIASGK